MTLIAGVLESKQCEFVHEYIRHLQMIQYGLCDEDCESDLFRVYNELKSITGANDSLFAVDIIAPNDDIVPDRGDDPVTTTGLQSTLQFTLG